MESDNPFIQRIHTSDEELENYEPITNEDAEMFHLRGQNYKFSNPGEFVFIDMPIAFIGLEVDEENYVKSMLLYLDEYETLLETLQVAFGPVDISMDIAGQAFDSSGTSQHSYTSHTWIKEDKYRMSFTVLPLKTDQSQLKAQLYITQE